MARPTDQLLARYVNELEERQTFIDGLVQAAHDKDEDLDEGQMELVTRARDRIVAVNKLMAPLEEARKISGDSAERIAELARYMENEDKRPKEETRYRSAGHYAIDMWRAGLGDKDADHRLELYNRAADHQTTSDNPGLIPHTILEPVLNFIDAARPLVSALGPRQLEGSLHRPKVTQHTAVAAQSAEKAELTSQAMTVNLLDISPATIGGYVNLSQQNLRWTSNPNVLDLVISDLAAQYAIMTEGTAVTAIYAGGTAATTSIPASPTADNVAAAFWGAAGEVYTATKGAGRVIAVASPDVLGIVGPLFAPINPVDAQSQGFTASGFGLGAAGAIGGIPVYITAGFSTTKRLMILSTAAAEVFEDRIGSLQVVEPSVLGLQVAYAGSFASLVTEATGIRKVTVT